MILLKNYSKLLYKNNNQIAFYEDVINKNKIKINDIFEDSIVVIADDINSISGDWVAKQYQYDDIDECLFESNNEHNIEKIIVDKDSVGKILNNIANKRIDIVRRYKNNHFMSSNNLSQNDIRAIIKQLSLDDYSYSLSSTNELHFGDILTIFITGKDFNLSNGRIINGLTLYIKIDDSDEGFVTVISIHESEFPEEESHPYN